MSELRQLVADAIYDADTAILHDNPDAHEEMADEYWERLAGSAISTIRAALLAPEAVEAFIHATGFDYEGSVRDGLTAALDAAGIGEGASRD